jgi:hypothetical protein
LLKNRGIFDASGTLHTNILNLPLPASNASFYKSFEGRNFAKIVLNAAILTLAKAQVEGGAGNVEMLHQQGWSLECSFKPRNFDSALVRAWHFTHQYTEPSITCK